MTDDSRNLRRSKEHEGLVIALSIGAIGIAGAGAVMPHLPIFKDPMPPYLQYLIYFFFVVGLLMAIYPLYYWISPWIIGLYKKHKKTEAKTLSNVPAPRNKSLIERDVWLLDAIWYIAESHWEGPPRDVLEPLKALQRIEAICKRLDNASTVFEDIVTALRQAACDGKLPIWGKNTDLFGGKSIWHLISQEHWATVQHQIDIFNVGCNVREDIKSGEWSSLMTSKTAVEELWPPQEKTTSKQLQLASE